MIRAALLAALLAGPASAQVIVDIPGPPLAATVSLDPALAADPAFQGFLREEAEAAVALWQDMAQDAGGGWWLTLADRVTYLSPRYASVLRRTETGVGDVRDMVALEGLTVDRGTGQLLRVDAFLDGSQGAKALADIARTVAEGIVEQAHGGNPPAEWTARIRAATRPDLAVLQNLTLERAADPALIGAIAFHFGAGEVAPDPVSVSVPVTVFRAGLKPAVRTAFTP